MALILVITSVGRAALVNAHNTGTLPVLLSHVGFSPLASAPSAASTTLPGEVKRIATFSGTDVADDTMHVLVQDTSPDSYTVRSFGLYLADGTLFAAYGQAGPIIEKSAQADMMLAIDVKFDDIDADAITFGDATFISPPATETVAGVLELATQTETTAGTDTQRAVTPKTLSGAMTARLASYARLDGATFTGAVTFNQPIVATTPNAGSTGGVRLRGNPVSGEAILQILTPDGQGQWGWMAFTAAGSFKWNANTVWHAGNDGAGSALDADLLDGQHGSYYTDIVGRLGFTPFNRDGGQVLGSVNVRDQVYASTPNDGTSGGIALRGNAASGQAILQIRTPDGQGQWGWMSFNAAGGISYSGNTVWHAGNDGSGSGLDADLLDGRDSTSFASVAGTAFTGAITAPSVEASSTGDVGQLICHRPGTVLYTVGGIGDGFSWGAKRNDKAQPAIGIDGNYNAYVTTHLTVGGNLIVPTGNGYVGDGLMWAASNDGSGSGLDADLLDGLHASSFASASHTHGASDIADAFTGSLQQNGYVALPGGLILQWGRFNAPANSGASVAFPTPFPNACFSAVVSGGISDAGAQDNFTTVLADTISAAGFQAFNADGTSSACTFFAVGF
ncbi:gp53-like domain-containing protein [Sphingomonas jatrophae]|uniref:Putative tail fiber protein gp53-like C-terminal domain-containing protein n=1 Tax=Sphingomonas jatrophae TaxID=1166337 RepID=A0A1I6JLK5_9SPHN|nr:hypothetical protein [Sphingomonas jatrophae]SFR79781.1 hypothetical protein SAMN05192580_0458 [Sphingomonas jatrophae]